MASESLRITARRYCVDDLPGASIPNARLQKILSSLQSGEQLSRLSLGFLQEQGLHALHRLATGELPYASFRDIAPAEQARRIQAAMDAQRAREAEERVRSAIREEQRQQAYAQAAAARRAYESTPAYRAKVKNQELRARYNITFFVEQEDFRRLMGILKRADAGQRLDEEDVVWLSTEGEDYFTDALRMAYHRLEADFLAGEFRTTRDPWAAINASSHYRKCGRAGDADALLSLINVERQPLRIQAAICTTRGGVMRDLSRWDEGVRLGERAHALQPRDYRPCTLLGAIHMETGQYDLGKAWYDKAMERGATVDHVDRDILTILSRLPQSRRSDLEAFLLRVDPTRLSRIQRRRWPLGHRR